MVCMASIAAEAIFGSRIHAPTCSCHRSMNCAARALPGCLAVIASLYQRGHLRHKRRTAAHECGSDCVVIHPALLKQIKRDRHAKENARVRSIFRQPGGEVQVQVDLRGGAVGHPESQ